MAFGVALRTSSDTTTPTPVRCSSSGVMLRWLALVFLGVTIAPVHCILPEITNNGIHHILDYNSYHGGDETPRDDIVVETVTERPTENKREEFEDAFNQLNQSDQKRPHDLPSEAYNETGSEKVVVGNHSVHVFDTILDNNIPPGDAEDDFTNTVVRATGKECIVDGDCEKGRYCLYDTHNSKCLPCKAVDVCFHKCNWSGFGLQWSQWQHMSRLSRGWRLSICYQTHICGQPCTQDEECCDGHTCVWGQCRPNATKGEAGSICKYQGDCIEDLCCAFHKALLFPVCSAKPIERERCLGPSNHLMERLSMDVKGEGPREHCPCVGILQCQPLGRGSLCLQGQKSSEEDLADTLYSEIDYIV